MGTKERRNSFVAMSDDEQSESGTDEYIVEKILKKKTVRGVVHYLVKWEGYECVTFC